MSEQILPTKKQREILGFIEGFIGEHGYSPSYREIMQGLNYNSVATVALHVTSLIKRGHLRKRDRSARSLEVVQDNSTKAAVNNSVKPGEEKWLVDKVEYFFRSLEVADSLEPARLDELYVLVGALKIMGLEAAAQSFIPRLGALKTRIK